MWSLLVLFYWIIPPKYLFQGGSVNVGGDERTRNAQEPKGVICVQDNSM